MFRAFYRPPANQSREISEDSDTLEGLSSGAILIIQMNEDGTRELISESTATDERTVYYRDYAKRQLEFKHDGGDTPDFREMRRNIRS